MRGARTAVVGDGRGSRGGVGVVLCCVALVVGAATTCAPDADAGTWTLVSCTAPDGRPAPTDGWASGSTGAVGAYSGDVNTCAEGGTLAALSSAQAPQSAYGGPQWTFTAPAGSTIAGGTITATLTSPHGQAWLGTPNAAYDSADVLANCQYNLACGAAGIFSSVFGIAHAGGTRIYATAVCVGSAEGATTCPAQSGLDAAVYVKAAAIELSNISNPAAGGFTGGLLAGAARGTQDVTFTAVDPGGPGIYRVEALLDGATLYSATPDPNSGSCIAAGTSAGNLMFTSAQPCKQSETVTLAIETAALTDGAHTLKLTLQDAAQNTSTVYDATITTANAPTNTTAPTILTQGTTLTAETGAWTAAPGAGAITYSYSWEDCDSHGTGCSRIPGASAASYTPGASDVGHTLRVLVSASDNAGASTASSSATSGILAPAEALTPTPTALGPATLGGRGNANGTGASDSARIELRTRRSLTRGFAHSAMRLGGRVTDRDGKPVGGATIDILASTTGVSATAIVGHALTSPDGSFTATVPAGASRTITLAYRAYDGEGNYTTAASIRETVAAGVQLNVAPRHTTPTGTIILSGTVQGQIPPAGVIVELLVHYRGRWEPFRTPRTDASGHFHLAYRFEGAVGRFPFRAAVPAGQAGLPYTSGFSNTARVSTG